MNNLNLRSFFSKHMRSSAHLDPGRDWIILMACSIIALSGIIVWNIWMFDTVASGGIIGAHATSTPPLFNQSSIDTVRAIFVNRAAEEVRYVSGTYRFADPSQ